LLYEVDLPLVHDATLSAGLHKGGSACLVGAIHLRLVAGQLLLGVRVRLAVLTLARLRDHVASHHEVLVHNPRPVSVVKVNDLRSIHGFGVLLLRSLRKLRGLGDWRRSPGGTFGSVLI